MDSYAHMVIRSRALQVLAWAACAAVAGCSDPTAGETKEATAANTSVAKKLIIETDVAPGEARAGIAFVAKCRAFEAPAQAGGALGAEVSLPGPATLDVSGGPAAPKQVNGLSLTFAKVGSYQVACRVPGTALSDATPATLYVVPGPPVAVDTQLIGIYGQPPTTPPPAAVKAGSLLQFACSATDALGNEIKQGFSITAAPAQPTPPVALVLAATTAGPLAVACAVEGHPDTTPVQLTVLADVPRHLYTLLEPPSIVAGNAASVQCVANDAYGNPIADFPFSLDFPAAVTMKGLYATSTKAANYKIQCVPETLAWDLFTLHPATLTVVPGPPSTLTVLPVPKKGVYKQSEKVKFETAVRDSFDNLIPAAAVSMVVTSPKAGFTVTDGLTIACSKDAVYKLHFTVVDAPELTQDYELVVDGTPPQLTIDYPPWGSTLQGKASVPVKGAAGDATSGVKSLTLNGKSVAPQQKSCQTDGDCTAGVCNPENYLCTIGTWVSQYGAKHGLNRLLAQTADLGDQTAKATRGFYYSGSYYPVDGAKPDAALVKDGLQVFLGKDFFDDGDHDPSHPNDLATIMEIAIAGLDVNTLLPPGGLSQGAVEVKLSNISFDKPHIDLKPVDGGMDMMIEIHNLKTDLDVKATQKLGPISVTVKVSGDIKIGKLKIGVGMGMAVFGGFVETKVTKTDAVIEDMKLHVDGIAGLFDFLWNMLLDAYKGQFTDQLVKTLNDQVPKLISGLLSQFAINQPIPVPSLVPGQPPASIQLVSKLMTLKFSGIGGLVLLDMGFSAVKGTTHNVLGAIARSGCIGTVEDAFAIDQGQRMQLAMHDDVINQLLYAIWYAGALKMDKMDLKALAGSGATGSPFPLDGATLDLDFFLQPVLETCGQTDPMKMRIQIGDLFAQANLPLGNPLSLGFFASLDLGATMALVTSPEGKQQLSIAIDPKIEYQFELASITKSYENTKKVFEDMITKLLTDQLAKGLPGLDKVALDLPSLDLGGLLPGLPAGAKIGLKVKKVARAGGFTSIDAALE